jgi:hypothetical protein
MVPRVADFLTESGSDRLSTSAAAARARASYKVGSTLAITANNDASRTIA